LDIDINDLRAMQTVENADVKAEILSQEELFLKLAGDLPKEMIFQRELLISRL
jgi:phosphoenolpyruvate carboxykinase (GTP)